MKNKVQFYIVAGISWAIALLSVFGAVQNTFRASALEQQAGESEKLYKQTKASLQTTQAKLEAKDKKELLAVLRNLPPTIGVANSQGGWVNIERPIPPVAGLNIRAFLPDTLQKMFPNELRYTITEMEVSVHRFTRFTVNTLQTKDNQVSLAQLSTRPGDVVMVSIKKMHRINADGTRTAVEPANNHLKMSLK